MDFGSDGFLGVGAPEIAVILGVGYFLLGPTELYRLAKEVGKLVTQLRTAATEASAQFSEAMESQLAISEIREVADDLQQAFSPMSTNPFSAAGRNERINSEAGLDPSLMYPETLSSEETVETTGPTSPLAAQDELGGAVMASSASSVGEEEGSTVLSEEEIKRRAAEQSKFHSQLDGGWNDSVLKGEGPWNNDYEMKDSTEPMDADDILSQLDGLEKQRLMQVEKLEEEFAMRRRLVDDQFSSTRTMVESFVRRKADLEARVKVMSEELESKEQALADSASASNTTQEEAKEEAKTPVA